MKKFASMLLNGNSMKEEFSPLAELILTTLFKVMSKEIV